MKTLYLHCGLHKTGTTSIQQFIFKNLKNLENEGIVCLDINENGTQKPMNLSSYIDHKNKDSGMATVKESLYQNLKPLSERGEKILMSSEAFSWLFDDAEINKLHKNLKNLFDSVKVIFYLRRQDHLASSHYIQRTKVYGYEGTYYKSGNNPFLPELDENSINYLDFNKRITMWANAFGDENMIIRIYDRDTLINGDIVDDFKSILDIKTESTEILANTTFAADKIKFHHELLKRGVKQKSMANKIAGHINSDRKFLIRKSEARALYDYFRESNILLNKRFRVNTQNHALFNENFDSYPEDCSYEWDEAGVQHIFDAICSFEKSNFNNNKTRVLVYKCVLELEKSNIDLAHKLLKYFLDCGMSSKDMQEKFIQYENRKDTDY